MQLTLGVDIGTSATKAVLVNDQGCVVAQATEPYAYDTPRPGWTEQDPQVWWQATVAVMQRLARIAQDKDATIIAVGLSGQMHGSVLLGEEHIKANGQSPGQSPDQIQGQIHDQTPGQTPDQTPGALRPALLWNDQRTAEQCTEIERAVGGRDRLVERVGNAALTGFTLPKLLWIRQHEPDTFRRIAAFMLPKDYVRFRLTGALGTDVGDGAGTLLLDVDRRCWDAEMVRTFDLDPAILPPVLESGAIAGHITPRAAAQTGLADGTPVIAGSGDNMMGAIGAGVVRPGMVLATLGTSGVLYAHTDQPCRDLNDPAHPAHPAHPNTPGRLHTMCAADGTADAPGGWCVTGCMLCAAGSLQWARDTLFPSATYDELIAEAMAAPPGCEGLVFLPYLTGERCPHPDPTARGGWIGLTTRHTRAHLVRAILEGVSFAMGQIMDLMRSSGVAPRAVRIGGGGSRSKLWRQLTADALDLPIVSTNAREGPAFGAALLAGTAVNVWPDIAAACNESIDETETLEPDRAAQRKTQGVADVYAQLYTDLRDRFAQLSAHAHAHATAQSQ